MEQPTEQYMLTAMFVLTRRSTGPKLFTPATERLDRIGNCGAATCGITRLPRAASTII
ncbi:hypothetical protein PISMIDRAFT_671738 [Pisolithus microcarpus 441]|uniref:Uncharacterized protein n=1 Tax=Pisolithus microcarpus 441 TaxID=765257 RepID=A0A0C9YXC8_9AGAM|nr:hypothetical protein PISMIDRAFT_671738 [Pisolithus microcarpus 441]